MSQQQELGVAAFHSQEAELWNENAASVSFLSFIQYRIQAWTMGPATVDSSSYLNQVKTIP